MARLAQRTISRIQILRAKGVPLTEIAERESVSYSSVYSHTMIKERYGSLSKYRAYLARKNNSASVKKRSYPSRFASYGKYMEYLAKQKRFASGNDYRKYLAEQRQKRPENKRFSELVRKRLKEKGKNLAWLANQIDATSGTVSSYAKGTSIPKGERFRKVCIVLDLPYKTIDDLVA